MALIELKRITKQYITGEEKVDALKSVDLTIEEGEFTAIMGSSGSGKSTLLNILGCLDQPTSGEYWLNNKDVQHLNVNQLSDIRNHYLGFIFQSFHLLPRLNVWKNIELPMLYQNIGKQERKQRAKALAERMGLGERMQHMPSQLSGGQRQRVAIARALANKPKLLLADEPTGNLDSKTTVEIMDILQELNQSGVTIILVTHEDELIDYTKRTIILQDGIVIKDEKKQLA
ncbi:ABC transporter ATP-binding protein [Gracilibacillus saliphilus]|uniref:ABC transporter ATP-binding protein n=1 Tax=Gracilibacillus saliphilus TaxID=543890 RepID=UPI0013D536EE|nr:ABC transporter ATP-binding protein [Gracilibacillus saliphilus]